MDDKERIQGYALRAGEDLPGAGEGVKASGTTTGGGLTLIESRTEGGAPMHVHSREDESMYLLEGSITVRCGDDTFDAGPRAFVFLPRGIPHAWDVTSGVATVLLFAFPAGLDDFLREFHAAPAERRDRIAKRYGIEFLR